MDDRKIKARVRSLARKECADYVDGLCITEDVPCHVISSRYDAVRDGAVECDYFMDIVLPLRPDLERWIREELRRPLSDGRKEKKCVRCGMLFFPTGNRQVACAKCGRILGKEKRRERNGRYYRKKRGIKTL